MIYSDDKNCDCEAGAFMKHHIAMALTFYGLIHIVYLTVSMVSESI